MAKRKTKTSQAHRTPRVESADESLLSTWAHLFASLGGRRGAAPIPTALERELPGNVATTVESRLQAMIDRLDQSSRRLARVAARLDRLKAQRRPPPTGNRAKRRLAR